MCCWGISKAGEGPDLCNEARLCATSREPMDECPSDGIGERTENRTGERGPPRLPMRPESQLLAPEASDEDVLRRRLERQRKARLEAEAISERTTRELYERQRELELLETVAVASNEAGTVEESLQAAL